MATHFSQWRKATDDGLWHVWEKTVSKNERTGAVTETQKAPPRDPPVCGAAAADGKPIALTDAILDATVTVEDMCDRCRGHHLAIG